MPSIIIAIERTGDQGFEDLLVNQVSELLSDLNYKLQGEIDERSDSGCSTNDRRLRFRKLMYGEQP